MHAAIRNLLRVPKLRYAKQNVAVPPSATNRFRRHLAPVPAIHSTRHREFISEQSSLSTFDGVPVGRDVVLQNADVLETVRPPERLRMVGVPAYVRYCSMLC